LGPGAELRHEARGDVHAVHAPAGADQPREVEGGVARPASHVEQRLPAREPGALPRVRRVPGPHLVLEPEPRQLVVVRPQQIFPLFRHASPSM
jgi:hypothetical protein